MKTPLKVFEELPNNYAQTNVVFSPDGDLFVTGTSVERDSTTGGLMCFFDRAKLELMSIVGISPTCSVVQCAWHPKLNQVTENNNLIVIRQMDVTCVYKADSISVRVHCL